jgi:hypothetical protein
MGNEKMIYKFHIWVWPRILRTENWPSKVHVSDCASPSLQGINTDRRNQDHAEWDKCDSNCAFAFHDHSTFVIILRNWAAPKTSSLNMLEVSNVITER